MCSVHSGGLQGAIANMTKEEYVAGQEIKGVYII